MINMERSRKLEYIKAFKEIFLYRFGRMVIAIIILLLFQAISTLDCITPIEKLTLLSINLINLQIALYVWLYAK